MESNVDLSQYRLSPEQLRWICPPDAFSFECTDELEELEGFLGQERALSSIEFGLRMEKSGYNLFVVGPTGTGRASAVKNRIERLVKEKKEKGITPEINDWCYIFNFDDPDRPQVLKLPRGEGKVLSRLVDELLKNLRDAIPKTFAGDEYKNQKQILIDEQQRKNRQIIQELEKEALEEGFAFRMTPMGPILIPLVEGKPMTQEQYLALGEEEKEIIESKRRELLTQISEAFDKIHQLEVELKNKIAELDRRVAEFAVNPLFKGLLDRYASSPEVLKFLESLQNFTLSYLHIFRDLSETPQQLPQLLPYQRLQDPFLPFKINVFVDNAPLEDPPIILETHPNWSNLFGKIERRAFMGAYFSDHTMLKSGSLHQANGGYIIMYFRDLISNPGVWEGLKRTLKNQEIRLEDPFEQFGIIAPQGLRPDPLPFDAKVIIIGDEYYYRALTLLDEDFRDLFKIKADFDYQIQREEEVLHSFACFVNNCCKEEGLLPFDRTGVAKVLEYGARAVSHQKKLSSQFGFMKDILVEADFWAREEGADRVYAPHVQKTLQERKKRLSLIADRLQEAILEDVLLIDTQGKVVGQINGLAVYDLGDYSFGRPSRITARTYLGKQGVVSIERESRLSGRIHDKGVLILGGYLGYKYAQNKPLSVAASICFEQSYEGVEGDSASLAETCAVLSSLAEVPIRQDIAVTGSINQKGEVQAIGGVNQKIEGFFRTAQGKGLTKEQGVIIPRSNIQNLMLEEEVVEAVREGKFHIYAVSAVDQAMEILTGLPAGEKKPDGTFEEGTLNYLVDEKLAKTVELLRSFEAKEKEEEKREENTSENKEG
ncbi:MAG TPA: ATP-binding protein [Candidatus Atribacteria bacterium]|nr:ATP-binding protein [Candidatus Atribacteria bacterium]HOQ51166.1 ATP-binding protein [Candidatus Atribacteria bacterium]HPT63411.1 ATP-binding protein [Candidatus Atribacteria bacterium]HPZ39338.1 ATP-binding protein [Candidatus Atribacteria bacterium]